MILQWQWKNLNQTLISQQTPNIPPSRVSYEVSIMRLWKKIYHVIMAPLCMYIICLYTTKKILIESPKLSFCSMTGEAAGKPISVFSLYILTAGLPFVVCHATRIALHISCNATLWLMNRVWLRWQLLFHRKNNACVLDVYLYMLLTVLNVLCCFTTL